MIASGSVPWYDRPARRFPVHIWQEKRFGFRVSLAPSAQPPVAPASVLANGFAARDGGAASKRLSEARRFPALVWLEKRQAGVSAFTRAD